MHRLVQHVGAAGKMHPDEGLTGSLKKLEPGTAAIMASVPPQVTQISVLGPPLSLPSRGELSPKVTERFSP